MSGVTPLRPYCDGQRDALVIHGLQRCVESLRGIPAEDLAEDYFALVESWIAITQKLDEALAYMRAKAFERDLIEIGRVFP